MTQHVPNILRGGAAIIEALDLIGHPGAIDKDMAKVICDNKVAIADFVQFGLKQILLSEKEWQVIIGT